MICLNCGIEYEPPMKRGRKSPYCCNACKIKYNKNRPKKFKKICAHCGSEFKTNSQKQQYCSTECSHTAKKTGRTIYTKICLYCGAEFQTTDKKHKYCTSACAARHAGDQRRAQYFCEYCGKPRWSDHPNRNRFCSRECVNKARHLAALIKNQEKVKEKEKRRLEMQRECAYCGTAFIPKNANHRFCSSECCYQWSLEKSHRENQEHFIPLISVCPHCGKIFATTLRAQDKQYCSELCRNRAAKERGKEIRKEQMKKAFVEPVGLKYVYRAYRGVCAICGLPVPETTEPSNQWAATVDHIIPLSKGGLHKRDNCQLAHRLCNSIKLDTEESFRIDWQQKLKENPGRWNEKLDALWEQLSAETIEAG
ncbi:MAG: HNH endonuclease [Butyrivibrio sp.]|nr:HNH endonuclease [Butyrivibrio sp.]